MIGGLLALLAAITFALNNAAFRRGALSGTVAQGMAISLAAGVGIFLITAFATGAWRSVAAFSPQAVGLLCAAGVLHFAWGRYCNFRATKAMGANLVGPPQQISILVTLGLAIFVLGETLTPLRVIGILLIILGPAVSLRAGKPTNAPDRPPPTFQPNYVEGYTFALLSATGYGASPVLVRTALEGGGALQSIAGGLIAYVAAASIMMFTLLAPGLLTHVRSVDPVARRWFSISGVLVCLSQMTGYMALSVAPVSVVMPIQRLSLVFRVFANSALNREHEVIGGRIWVATFIGLLGAVALSVSTDFVLAAVPLPDWLEDAAKWRWP